MSSTPTRFYNSTMRGLGGINGTPGSLVSIMDKVCVTGAGEVTAINITVLNGVATANLNVNEGFQRYTTVRITGSDIAALNGDHFLFDGGDNFAKWYTGAANGTTTTTVTIKIAPLGFVTQFTGANRRVYKSASVDASGHSIQVNDTTAMYATIYAYETATSVTAGTNKNPIVETTSMWPKSISADAVMKDWVIIADDKGIYWGIAPDDTYKAVNDISEQPNPFCFYFVGEGIDESPIKGNMFIVTTESGPYSVANSGYQASYAGFANLQGFNANSLNYASHTVSRDYSGVTKSSYVYIRPEIDGNSYSGRFTASMSPPYPNPSNNKVFVTPYIVMEQNTLNRRGKMPGAYALAHSGSGALRTGSILTDVVGLENRNIMVFSSFYSSYTVPEMVLLFDITGGWRT